ncbi:MAG TPA: PQQ-dependent sugar dehydrogenase [Thermoanaerobaculia bacterium]|nr:PQQ-dependent sugar dehydrogenase [Thermoanaerobaculia bacterium]
MALETLSDDLPPFTSVVNAGDDRLFLPAIDGRILIWDRGAVRPEPFLDLRPLVTAISESGLQSVVFHPRYTANGFFFVYYTDLNGRPVLARYRVSDHPDRAEPSSAAILLHLGHPSGSHFGGQLQFGPDGYLYVGIGDGGDHYDPWCNAQRLDDVHGKILRLDVDAQADEAPFYAIPPTNPFTNVAGARGEIWARGLRNPWRFTFDRATGDLYIGDVGESAREEISLQPASSRGGENYGWARYEGTQCIDRVGTCPSAVPTCGDPALVAPILEYPGSDLTCNAVMGGYVYRGAAIPGLRGAYLFGDYCTGVIKAARRRDDGFWTSEELAPKLETLTGFGEDVTGEIYLASRHGVLAKLVSAQPPGNPPRCSRDETKLCLNQGRFRVAARWVEPGAESRAARAVTLSDDTGYFWFLGRTNVELVIKVLDGCETPLETYWVFAAGLTDLDVTLTVTDVSTGAERRYHNAAGQPFPSLQDTTAFPCR